MVNKWSTNCACLLFVLPFLNLFVWRALIILFARFAAVFIDLLCCVVFGLVVPFDLIFVVYGVIELFGLCLFYMFLLLFAFDLLFVCLLL